MSRKYVVRIAFITILLALQNVRAAEAPTTDTIGPDCSYNGPLTKSNLYTIYPACSLDKLSWVEVTFWNDATHKSLKITESELESLLRATSRRLLPDLEHEVIDPSENFMSIVKEQLNDERYVQRRAHLHCSIGSQLNGQMYALVNRCTLRSFEQYIGSKNPAFTSGVLMTGPSREINEASKESLRTLLQDISDKVYKQISDVEQISTENN